MIILEGKYDKKFIQNRWMSNRSFWQWNFSMTRCASTLMHLVSAVARDLCLKITWANVRDHPLLPQIIFRDRSLEIHFLIVCCLGVVWILSKSLMRCVSAAIEMQNRCKIFFLCDLFSRTCYFLCKLFFIPILFCSSWKFIIWNRTILKNSSQIQNKNKTD